MTLGILLLLLLRLLMPGSLSAQPGDICPESTPGGPVVASSGDSAAAPASAGGDVTIANHCPDYYPPTVWVEPGSSMVNSATLAVTISWSEFGNGLASASRSITLNGVNVTSSFSYSGTSMDATSSGTVTLQPGTNTLQASICDVAYNCGSGGSTWTYDTSAGLKVTPDGSVSHFAANGGGSVAFHIENTSSQPVRASLTLGCTGVTSCAAHNTYVDVPANGAASVPVSFRTGAAGSSGSVTLGASGNGMSDNGSVQVSVGNVAAAGYPGDARGLQRIERSQCVAAGIGDGVAYECGDLRVSHALPATRVLNTSRAPALIYNSGTARPNPWIAAHLAPRAGTRPDTVRGSLVVNGVAYSAKWPGWPSDTVKRVAMNFDATNLATGIYPYTLQINGTWNTGASESLLVRTGQLIIVNRSASPFGAGWWLSGVEQLVHAPGDSLKLWVGGDGSARIYRGVPGSGRWVADPFDRPDTLTYDGARGEYVRTLPGRVEIRFNGAGEHVRTVNKHGHESVLTWTSGRLTSLGLPRASGFNTGYAYTFEYANTGGTRLSRVIAPGPVDYRYTNVAADAIGRITSITDPDTSTVSFGWSTATVTRFVMVNRTDRRSAVQTFGYGSGRLSSTRLVAAVGDTIVISFRAAEAQGAAAVAEGSVYTQLNGARTDVSDVTQLWLNSWGAPYRIRDAAASQTYLTRGDPSWPAAVTRMLAPDGHEVTASYDARGNVSATTDWSLQKNNGFYATTTYAWDPVWDAPVRVTMPEGDATYTAYDGEGRTAWTQPGIDPARRVSFSYHPSTSTTGPGLVASATQPGNRVEQYEYDAWGNLSAVVSPLGFRTEYLNDRIGRTVRTSTPIDAVNAQVDSARYDLKDRPVHTRAYGPALNGAAAQALLVDTEYDREGNILRVSRQASPDAAGIGVLTTRWEYDLIGRKTVEIAPDGARDSTFYDKAGNVVRQRLRRQAEFQGDLTQQYDALNRLTKRIVPAVRYAPRDQGLAQRGFIMPWEGGTSSSQPPPYPWYPNEGGGGYLIPADTVVYAYDRMNRVIRADNRDARIRRSWFPGGRLKGDTLRIRTVAETSAGGSFEQHVYGLEYTYDLNGRTIELKHPTALAPIDAYWGLSDRTNYAYDAQTGALREVTNPLRERVAFHYDARGLPDSVYLPGGITQSYAYDADGRLSQHGVYNGSTSAFRWPESWLRLATFTYDRRGKLLQSQSQVGSRDTTTSSYTGLGHVLTGTTTSWGNPTPQGVRPRSLNHERLRHDALGNITSSYTTQTLTIGNSYSSTSSDETRAYQAGTGRLLSSASYKQTDTYEYDAAGNVVFVTQSTYAPGSADPDLRDVASFYGADGKLRAVDTRTVFDPTYQFSAYTRAFEEYRYDALGRRVWVRARRNCHTGQGQSPECKLGKIRRVVWDGDQELYEIQMPGDDLSPYLENDTTLPAYAMEGPYGAYVDRNPFFGRVVYTYGLTVDQPLSVTRMMYGDVLDSLNYIKPYRRVAPFSIFPLWNERGQPFNGVFADGGVRKCAAERCVYLAWPGTWFAYARPRFQSNWWHGSLLEDKQDAAGTHYRRNRYYDPLTGRFTQEDPIGLAGGVNLYGFADGDPVNFADPFGLSAEDGDPPGLLRRITRAVVRKVGPPLAALVVQAQTVADHAPWSQTPPVMDEVVERSASGQTARGAQSTARAGSQAPAGGRGTGSGAGSGSSAARGASTSGGRAAVGRVIRGVVRYGGPVVGIMLSPDKAGSERPAACNAQGQCLYQE